MNKKMSSITILTIIILQLFSVKIAATDRNLSKFEKAIQNDLQKIYNSQDYVFGTEVTIHYKTDRKGNVIGYNIVQFQSKELKEKIQAANQAADLFYRTHIENKIPKTDPDWRFKREMEIIKYMVENIDYAVDRYYNNKISYEDGTAYGALVTKECVCSGYAHGFRLLALRCGLESYVVQNENHAWNIIRLDDGNYYHLDVTWEDPLDYSGKPNRRYGYKELRNEYINLTSEELTRKDTTNAHSSSWQPSQFQCDSYIYGPLKVKEYLSSLTLK